MMKEIARRRFLKTSALSLGCLAAGDSSRAVHAAEDRPASVPGGNDQFKIMACFEIRHTLAQHTGITRLANDDLLFGYGDYTDAMEGQTGYLLRSTDRGRSWSDPILTIRPRKQNGGTHTSLGMQTLKSGRVLVPWYDGINRKKFKNKYPADLYVLRSDDHGHTWQGWEPQPRLGLWNPLPYGKVVELPDGSVLCPAWTHLSAKDKYSDAIAVVLRSKDQGRTFTEYHKISDHSNETDLTLLADGRLLALLRGGWGGRGLYTFYSHSSDGGKTWTDARSIGMFSQNFNAWYTSKGTLVAACRGIDGSGVLDPSWFSAEERKSRMAKRVTPQVGYGIQFFRATTDDGSRWEYLFTLPNPAGRKYTAWHESGEPSFCNLPNGDLLMGYYSYKESIYQTLDPNMPAHTKSESKRIPHCFKRRPCGCILREA